MEEEYCNGGDEGHGNFFTQQAAVIQRFLPPLLNIKVVSVFFTTKKLIYYCTNYLQI